MSAFTAYNHNARYKITSSDNLTEFTHSDTAASRPTYHRPTVFQLCTNAPDIICKEYEYSKIICTVTIENAKNPGLY